jgi:hypothetical protein
MVEQEMKREMGNSKNKKRWRLWIQLLFLVR